jgi:hypothetical protein
MAATTPSQRGHDIGRLARQMGMWLCAVTAVALWQSGPAAATYILEAVEVAGDGRTSADLDTQRSTGNDADQALNAMGCLPGFNREEASATQHNPAHRPAIISLFVCPHGPRLVLPRFTIAPPRFFKTACFSRGRHIGC